MKKTYAMYHTLGHGNRNFPGYVKENVDGQGKVVRMRNPEGVMGDHLATEIGKLAECLEKGDVVGTFEPYLSALTKSQDPAVAALSLRQLAERIILKLDDMPGNQEAWQKITDLALSSERGERR